MARPAASWPTLADRAGPGSPGAPPEFHRPPVTAGDRGAAFFYPVAVDNPVGETGPMKDRRQAPPPTRYGVANVQKTMTGANVTARTQPPPPTRFGPQPAQAKNTPTPGIAAGPDFGRARLQPPPTRFGAQPAQPKSVTPASGRRLAPPSGSVIQAMENLSGILNRTGGGIKIMPPETKDNPKTWIPVLNENDAFKFGLITDSVVNYRIEGDKAIIITGGLVEIKNTSTNDKIEEEKKKFKGLYEAKISSCISISILPDAKKHYEEASGELPNNDEQLILYVIDRLTKQNFDLSEGKYFGTIQVKMPIDDMIKWSVIGSYKKSSASMTIFHYGPGG